MAILLVANNPQFGDWKIQALKHPVGYRSEDDIDGDMPLDEVPLDHPDAEFFGCYQFVYPEDEAGNEDETADPEWILQCGDFTNLGDAQNFVGKMEQRWKPSVARSGSSTDG